MGTRKLLTSLAFVILSTACFAQARTAKTTTPTDNLSSTGDAIAEIKVYKDAFGKNVISWTSTGLQSLEFLLQGSTDGKVFRAIKRMPVTASGKYETSDESHPGFSYFRIICIDKGGHFSYSRPASAR
jgi:hypothetical protein